MIRYFLALGILVGSAAAAQADTFGFTYSQGDSVDYEITLAGTLTAVATATPGQYTIVGAGGTEVFMLGGNSTTSNITGVLNPDTAYGASDMLYTSGLVPYLDTSGVTFVTDGTGTDFQGDVNINYNDYQGTYASSYEFPTDNDSFSLTAVPEPASLSVVLASLGVAAVSRGFRRRS
jgi:hypothetical protein